MVRTTFVFVALGAFVLAAAPSVGHAADVPKSYKSTKAKKPSVKKSTARAGVPQSKAGPTMQYNPPGSRVPMQWRY
ncbi:MAG: hypothetical protein K2Y29_08030 [Beijerinckiaceae bacterium]|nr:hypothetical protein [Beijerinckiaceae bacterium]